MYINFTFNKFSFDTYYFNIYCFIGGLPNKKHFWYSLNAAKNQIWILIQVYWD